MYIYIYDIGMYITDSILQIIFFVIFCNFVAIHIGPQRGIRHRFVVSQ